MTRLGPLVLLVAVAAAVSAAATPAFLLLISGTTLDQAVSVGVPVLGATGPLVIALLRNDAEIKTLLPAGTTVLARVVYDPQRFTYFIAEDDAIKAWSQYTSDKVHLAWQEPSHAIFRADNDNLNTDTLFRSFLPTTEIVTLPTRPIRPVASASRERLRKIAAEKLFHRDNISDLVNAVDQRSLQSYVRYLTGEDTTSPLLSRNSYSEGGVVAGMWVEKLFQEAGFTTQRPVFDDTFCPNVIAEKRGTTEPDKIVVLGAHLDDRATMVSSPTQRAPGANDDGSGSAMLLEAARVIASLGATFRYTLRIVAFCGEEQGLVGSRAYASQLASDREDVIAMLQGDMIGYQVGAQPELSFVTRYTDPDLTAIVTNVTATYVPTLRRSTTTACCSDHQSFLENGYASAGFVEAGGYTIDPQYHKEGDLSERTGYSFQQLYLITQALVASTAVLADMN